MMKQGVFETNSSSVHSVSIGTYSGSDVYNGEDIYIKVKDYMKGPEILKTPNRELVIFWR